MLESFTSRTKRVAFRSLKSFRGVWSLLHAAYFPAVLVIELLVARPVFMTPGAA